MVLPAPSDHCANRSAGQGVLIRIFVVVSAMLFIVTPAQTLAQETKTWVGETVVFKEPTRSPMSTGDVQGSDSFQVFTVKRASRGLVYIVAGDAGFWVPSREVVLEAKVGDYLTDQIRLNPQRCACIRQKGLFPAEKEGLRQCHRRLRRGDQTRPEEWPGVLRPGPGWQHKKDFAKAIAEFNDAIRLEPRFAAAYNGRAWLWATCTDAKFRDAAKAVESARKACELSSGSRKAVFLDTLAAAYAEAGNFEDAVKAQSEANDLFPFIEQRKRGARDLSSTCKRNHIGSEIEGRKLPARGPHVPLASDWRSHQQTLAPLLVPDVLALQRLAQTRLSVQCRNQTRQPRR